MRSDRLPLTTLLISILLLPLTAAAQESSVGFGAALGVDLSDRAQGPIQAEFSPGVGLLVPVRIGLTPAAAFRANVRIDHQGGTDVISWEVAEGQRAAEQIRAWVFSLGATVGPEVTIPLEGAVRPYLAGGVGGAVVGTYHSFTRCALMDPALNDCEDSGNIDPYTTQPAFLTDAALGARVGGDGPVFWLEAGYSAAFLAARPLTKSEPLFSVQREAYAWNAVRAAAGVAFPL